MTGRRLDADEPVGPAPVVAGSLGVFGGTFDPIHIAHLAVAEAARDALGLERVLFIPAGAPAAQAGPAHHRRRSTAWRWSSSRSPATRPSPPAGSSSTAPGRRTRVDTLEALAADDPRT